MYNTPTNLLYMNLVRFGCHGVCDRCMESLGAFPTTAVCMSYKMTSMVTTLGHTAAADDDK